MKKMLLIFVGILFVFTMSACSEFMATGDNTITEDELRELIVEVINEQSVDKDSYTQEELQALIESLLPENTYETTYELDAFQDAVISMLAEVRDGVLGVSVTTADGGGTGSGVVYKREGCLLYTSPSPRD